MPARPLGRPRPLSAADRMERDRDAFERLARGSTVAEAARRAKVHRTTLWRRLRQLRRSVAEDPAR